MVMVRLGVLGLIVVCAVLLFTNPSQDAHKKTVYASIATEATASEFLGKLTTGILTDVDVIPLQYNNYYLFSTTSLNGKTESIGIFSHVWKWK
jgi:hypothetical protein